MAGRKLLTTIGGSSEQGLPTAQAGLPKRGGNVR
jgi:hypothetical protein